MTRNSILILAIAVASCLGPIGAFGQEATKTPHVPLQKTIGQVSGQGQGPVATLAVINSDGATLEGNKLTLTGVSNNAIVFADRPVRAAGHVTTAELVKQWGQGPDNLAKDPPNATISVLGGDGTDVSDAVVTLKSPKLEGTTLTFDVAVLEGKLGASGPAALFIDHWYGRGAWYGVGLATGAVLGAAAVGARAAPVYAAPYYPYRYYAPPPPYVDPYYYHRYARCGYYPYPPCY